MKLKEILELLNRIIIDILIDERNNFNKRESLNLSHASDGILYLSNPDVEFMEISIWYSEAKEVCQ